jgi:S1-C subfamily serine protease
MEGRSRNNVILILIVFVLVMASAVGGALADRLFVIKPLDYLVAQGRSAGLQIGDVNQTILHEENVVIDVAEKVSPSVVTVSIQTQRRRILEFNPFGGGFNQRYEGGTAQDIGTGFVVDANGVIVTNKHVVSETGASYKVITQDGKEYDVKEISRDPSNDLAVLKIDASGLTPVTLGDSGNLKAGQFVIAIGTALGEFRHTVTTGVISGLGRGITAGSAYEGYVERLDDVIQTDAAINPGNSGGPLLNSAGQVIGVNVAVAQGAQNVGFAIPVNTVKDALSQYNQSGKFASKPYLGVEYQMISQQSALLNEVPQGAYIQNVVTGSPAEKAGLQVEDIIVKIDGTELKDQENGLAGVISGKKPGQTISLEVWRNGETKTVQATLSEFSE